MKKLLFLALFLMCAGIVSAATVINNCADLAAVDSACSGDYELAGNINGSCLTQPLCDGNPAGSQFRGTFDGKGYCVYDLNLTMGSFSYPLGLFGHLFGSSSSAVAVIQNLGVCNSTFETSGANDAGALVGTVGGYTLIENCYSLNNVLNIPNKFNIGGLIGNVYTGGAVPATASVINNSYAMSNYVRGKGQHGGLIGYLRKGLLDDSYSANNTVIPAGFGPYGGLIGLYSSSLTDSYSDLTNDCGGSTCNTCGSGTCPSALNITEYSISQLNWTSPPWCKAEISEYPLLLYSGTGMNCQFETCDSCDGGACSAQGPSGNGDEVIPEFSNTGKIVVTVIALIVVAIVASMLMKKKQ